VAQDPPVAHGEDHAALGPQLGAGRPGPGVDRETADPGGARDDAVARDDVLVDVEAVAGQVALDDGGGIGGHAG
jgi:hypothetical protein